MSRTYQDYSVFVIKFVRAWEYRQSILKEYSEEIDEDILDWIVDSEISDYIKTKLFLKKKNINLDNHISEARKWLSSTFFIFGPVPEQTQREMDIITRCIFSGEL